MNKPGHLQRGSGRSKKLLEWNFYVPTIEGSMKVPVTVMIHPSMNLCAHAKGMPSIEDTDIKSLYAKVEKALQDANVHGVDWQEWIKVTVSGSGHKGKEDDPIGRRESVYLDTEMTHYGFHPITKEPYVINKNGYSMAVKKTPVRIGGEDFYLGGDETTSYIPATPENTAAVLDICDRIAQLRLRLKEVLGQEQVQETLNNVSGTLPLIENKKSLTQSA